MTRVEARRRRRIRRLALVITLSTALAMAASFAPAAAGGGNDDSTPEAFATISKIYSQTVEVKKKGADDFKPAEEGDELKVGDTVRTDATGRVRVNYADDSYTRLDFNTTFTIEKLSDEQGNRQVEGSLENGNAWHRTAELTESQTFEQSGAGATAAVVGTAFAIECVSATQCTTIAVVNGIRQEGTGGVVNLLDPFDFCEATNGELCDEVQTRTLAEMIADLWVQYSLWLDFLEFGLGPGPFSLSGILVVENGQVVSFTPNPSGAPPAPAVLDTANPIGCQGGCPHELPGLSVPAGFTPDNSMEMYEDHVPVVFVANVDNPSGLPYYVVFTVLPNDGDTVGVVSYCNPTCGAVSVSNLAGYDGTAGTFLFTPANVPSGTHEGRIVFHLTADPSRKGTVNVSVRDCLEVCGPFGSEVSALTEEPAPADSPAADPPADDPPPSTEPESPPGPESPPPAE